MPWSQLSSLKRELSAPVLSLDGYVSMKRTWSSLGVDDYLSSVSLNAAELTQAILRVGYSLLKQAKYEETFALMTSARSAGLADPWLADCEARALLFQDEFAEAMAIWQALLASGDERLERNSQKMLSYSSRRQQDAEDQRIDAQVLEVGGDMNALLGLWTQCPESTPVELAVHALIRSRLSLEDPSWRFMDPALQDHQVALEAQVAWLASLQTRRSAG